MLKPWIKCVYLGVSIFKHTMCTWLLLAIAYWMLAPIEASWLVCLLIAQMRLSLAMSDMLALLSWKVASTEYSLHERMS